MEINKIAYYAGIGSRETPENVLKAMHNIAVILNKLGYTLRSGGAIGADTAFESGAGNLKSIYYANNATTQAIDLASQYHPAWHKCSAYAQKLHGRNMQILLGNTLDTPVEFIICWTPNSATTGGTGQALRYAIANDIKIYNLANQPDINALHHLLTNKE